MNEGSHWLYERWVSIAQKNPSEIALVDWACGKRWTFAELRRDSERGDERKRIAFCSGHHADFVLSVLRAWRAGNPVCPLEVGQPVPNFTNVPGKFAHLKLTSASTGAAKSIAFAPHQLAADPANIVSTMGLRPDWPNLACISLSHSYGFSNFILPLLLHGIPLVIIPAPLPEVILRASAAFTGVTVAAVPALWHSWMQSSSIPKNVKLAISAGAPLPLELEQQVFERQGLKIHNFYGSSECGGIAYDRSEVPRSDPSFAGTEMDNVRLTLSSSGTLIVESPAVAETYWPEAQPNLLAPRFETTDLAEVHQGRIFLRGRATDLINVAGRKVTPESIEAALRQHHAVRECLVFGIDNGANDRFDTIVGCVHLNEKIETAALVRFLSERLPNWQIPRQWWFTAELLPNARGKLSRAEWRRRFSEMRSALP
jgi:long-chain acyl-CoA synthetase